VRVAFTYNLKTTPDEEQAEFDTPETVAMLEGALRQLGHEVTLVEASGSVRDLVGALEAARPELIFNTAEGGVGRGREAYYPALYERMGIPFTGSDAYVCTVTLDKHLSKLLVAQRGVRVPGWVFVRSPAELAAAGDLRFPLIVKPNFEGSSKGITAESVVEDAAALERRVSAELPRFPDGLLCEEYIVGRDVVVPFLEAASPATRGVLDPAEYVYRSGGRRFAIFELAMKQRGFDDVEVRSPARLDEAVRAAVTDASRAAVEVLGVRDLARMDFRVTDGGDAYFLEMNALPSLEPGASIYLSGARAGLDGATGVVEAVVTSAARRYALRR
jgi:D-alanine-D-alanine ligase